MGKSFFACMSSPTGCYFYGSPGEVSWLLLRTGSSFTLQTISVSQVVPSPAGISSGPRSSMPGRYIMCRYFTSSFKEKCLG